MKEYIRGNKYNFIIHHFKIRNKFYFSIEALSKHKLIHSFINNMNCILSEFGISIKNKRIMESEWLVTENEIKNFVKQAKNFLEDKSFRIYVEEQLDLDRVFGEWNKL